MINSQPAKGLIICNYIDNKVSPNRIFLVGDILLGFEIKESTIL